jgi:uncharacterized lipoprotein YddW (UPF0748 family)
MRFLFSPDIRFRDTFSGMAPICRSGVLLCLFVVVPIALSHAQHLSSPRREVRAVWLTTAAGLDWPRSLDRATQQSSLRTIVADLKHARFNTILFQVRARGDAYYHSEYEPWAENLTGTLGKDPGWDPLGFLLTEAHAAGMEVHAWFNVYKVRGLGPIGVSDPPHPVQRFPASVFDVDGEAWLDPGFPEVRDYLVRVTLDLVRKYDLDGINFDFIRYPGKNFPDADSYRKYGGSQSKDDWRRSNVTRFVAAVYDSIMAIRPMLKVGSAPVGIYMAGSNGNSWGAYVSYFQDAQGWMAKRIHDYVAPQIYWDLGATRDDPDFATVLRSWVDNAGGRDVWAGIGAYKTEVLREIPWQIDSARAIGASGEAYFRYEHIASLTMFDGRYNAPANIPPMAWKDSIPPLSPSSLAVTERAPRVFHLEWLPPPRARDGDGPHLYNIFRSATGRISGSDASALVATIPATTNYYIDTVADGMCYMYYYAVSALDRGNNESPLTPIAAVTSRILASLRAKLTGTTTLTASVARDPDAPTLLAYSLASEERVSLEVTPQTPDSTRTSNILLADSVQQAGTYFVGISSRSLLPGRYNVRLRAGDVLIEQNFQIDRR